MIHDENPFIPEPGDRDPVRRFRGRVASGVTIVTTGGDNDAVGLTVSSLMVIEGTPAMVMMVVGPTSDLWSALDDSGRFVVHICHDRHRGLANVFAGLAPAPGGMFRGLEILESEWGPVLDDLPDRLYCTTVGRDEVGLSGVVTGEVQRVEISELDDPLVHFRGGYPRLGD